MNDESKRDFIAFSLLLIIVAVAGVGSYLAFRNDEQRRTRLVAEVPAEVTEMFFARGRDPKTGMPDSVKFVRVSFRYVVSGKIFSQTVTMNKTAGRRFEQGKMAKVCYNPSDPTEAELVLEDYRCGN